MGLGLHARMTLLFLLLFGSALFPSETVSKTDTREQSWSVLEEGLTSEKASQRQLAVQALSLMPHDRKATQAALHALHDKDRHVRASAAVTLGQLGAHGAIPALKNALDDPEIAVALAAAQSLFLLKDKSAYEVYYAILMGDRKSSAGLMQTQLDRLKDPKQMAQIGIAEGIGFVPFGGIGYEAYKQIRSNKSAAVRALAARFLAHDPDKISEDALIQAALADNDDTVRLAALDSLAERNDPTCVERLEKNLSDDKPPVRYRTAAAILHLVDTRTTRTAQH